MLNILHLKYAVEIEKSRSLNKAAVNLFVSQPNLSRAIKELEHSLGITIFRRTSKGMIPTEKGAQFLCRAKEVLAQLGEIEQLYKCGADAHCFSVSAPHAEYIADAFAEFSASLYASAEPSELYFTECGAFQTVENILHSDYHLGIIRYDVKFEQDVENMLYANGLKHQNLCIFDRYALMSKAHRMSAEDKLDRMLLSEYAELVFGDDYAPTATMPSEASEPQKKSARKIKISDRASCLKLLCGIDGAYALTSPTADSVADSLGLVQVKCADGGRYKDALVHRREYTLSNADKAFIDCVKKCAERANISPAEGAEHKKSDRG